MKITLNKKTWYVCVIFIALICLIAFHINDLLYEKTRDPMYDSLEFITKIIYSYVPFISSLLFCIFRKKITENFALDSKKIDSNTSVIWFVSVLVWSCIIRIIKNIFYLFPYPYNCLFNQTRDFYLNGFEHIISPIIIAIVPIIIIHLNMFRIYIMNLSKIKESNQKMYGENKKSIVKCVKWCAMVMLLNLICLIVCPTMEFFLDNSPFSVVIIDIIPIILLACYYIYDNALCKKINLKRAYLTAATLISSLFIMANFNIWTILMLIRELIGVSYKDCPDYIRFSVDTSARLIIYSAVFLTIRLIYKKVVEGYSHLKITKYMWLIKSAILLLLFIADIILTIIFKYPIEKLIINTIRKYNKWEYFTVSRKMI